MNRRRLYYTDEGLLHKECFEVWHYDNYADDSFYCAVYCHASSAYRACHRLTKKHDEAGGDWFDYFWIIATSLKEHNALMKELGKTSEMLF